MKDWPEGGKPANFSELVGPLVRALRFAFDLKRKNRDKNVPYNGFERGSLHCALAAKEALSAKQLRYSEEEQGRKADEEIIGLAVAIGIEQGIRIERSDGLRRVDTLLWRAIHNLATDDDKDPAEMLKAIASITASYAAN